MANNKDLINKIKKMVDEITNDSENLKKQGATVVKKNGMTYVYTKKKGKKK